MNSEPKTIAVVKASASQHDRSVPEATSGVSSTRTSGHQARDPHGTVSGTNAANSAGRPVDALGDVARAGLSTLQNANSAVSAWAEQNDPMNFAGQVKQQSSDPTGYALAQANPATPIKETGAIAYDTVQSVVSAATTIAQHPQMASDIARIDSPADELDAAGLGIAARVDPALGKNLSDATNNADGSLASTLVNAIPGSESFRIARDPNTARDVAGAMTNIGSNFVGDGAGKVAAAGAHAALNALPHDAVDGITHLFAGIAPASRDLGATVERAGGIDLAAAAAAGVGKDRLATLQHLSDAGFEQLAPTAKGEQVFRAPGTQATLTLEKGANPDENEISAAKYLLQQDGKDVTAIPRSKDGKRPDFRIDGKKVELKTQSNSAPNKWSANIRQTFEKAAVGPEAEIQSKNVIIDARGQGGVTQAEARELAKQLTFERPGTTLRFIGKDMKTGALFDISAGGK